MAKPIINTSAPLLRAPSKSDILPSVLLLLTSRAAVLGGFPFGAAFFAACFDKSTAYLGITVMYLGLFSTGSASLAVKYMMAALMYWLFINLYRRSSRAIEAVVCGGALMLSGLSTMLYSFSGAYDIFMLFIESCICGVMYAVFSLSKNAALHYKSPKAVTQEELLSISAAVGVFILGLGKTQLPFGISIANILAVYAVLTAALNSEISGAAMSGLTIGFITGGDGAVAMMGACGISAVFGGFLRNMGKIGVSLGFLGGACAVLLLGGAQLPYSIWDVLIGAALFSLTPKFIHEKIGAVFGTERRIEEVKDGDRLRAYISDRLSHFAEVFGSLEKAFAVGTDRLSRLSEPSAEDIYAETAGRVCMSCARCSKCWDKEPEKTVKGMSELLDAMQRKGEISISSMPLAFREKCLRPEHMILELGHVYELFRLKLAQTGERLEERESAAAQYRETAAVFAELAHELEDDFEFCTELEEEAVRAFDRIGITVFEISICEGSRTEAYLRISDSGRIGEAEGILSEITGVNMGFDRDEGGGMFFVSRPRFSVDTGVKQLSKEESCGDTVSVFGTDKYKLFCIICDGMGTGGKAAEKSAVAAGMLREFLEAGFGTKTAVELVNSSMCRSADDEYFTTLDLLCVDLMNGSAEFYKIGSAQSFMYRHGKTETLFSAAFPIGISAHTEVLPQSRRLEDGDVLVLASDGITEAGERRSEWLKNQIKTPHLSMQSMAEEITARALEKNGGEIKDDMSVIALKITEN